MLKNTGIDKTLYWYADSKFKLKIAIKPRVIPQPKQLMPNSAFIGHSDIEKTFVKMKRKMKKTSPTPEQVQ